MRDLRQPDSRFWPWLCALGLLALGALQVSRAQAPSAPPVMSQPAPPLAPGAPSAEERSALPRSRNE